MPTTTRGALPSYQELIYPTIRAVDELGGSAQAREITAQVLADIGASDEQLAIISRTVPSRYLLTASIGLDRTRHQEPGAFCRRCSRSAARSRRMTSR